MQEFVLDDVYDVWFTSFWQTLPGYAILSILALLIIFVGYLVARAVYIYRTGTSKDKALRSLRALSESVEKGQVELGKVYQELTDIVKSYAQWRYAMPRGMTDYELVTWLQDVGCAKDQRQEIERIITDAQAVKFGCLDAPKRQVLANIDIAASFIEVAGERTT